MAADRRMSEADLAGARENYERLEIQTAKRVVEFYEARRDARSVESPPVVPQASASFRGRGEMDAPTEPARQAS
jgi:hypothetical protein